MSKLPEKLLERIRARASDPDRRTYMGGTEGLPPPSDAEWAAAEEMLARPLPPALKQLYAIGNGGFGPGGGLLTIQTAAFDYRDRRSSSFGPLGQAWPKDLLVLTDPNETPLCLDLENGKIVAWEADRIENEESDADWQASFVEESPNLARWFEDWLGAETHEELRERVAREHAERVEARGKSPVTGFPIQFDDVAEQIEAEIAFLSVSADLRETCGLPEHGWEEEVQARYGHPK